MEIGQLYALTNDDLAIPKFIGKSHVVYDVFFNEGDEIDLKKYTRSNPDCESVQTIDEFKKLVKVETQLFDRSYIR